MSFTANVVLTDQEGERANLGVHVFENLPRDGETVVLTPDGFASDYYTVAAIEHWPLPEEMPPSNGLPALQRARSFTMIYVRR